MEDGKMIIKFFALFICGVMLASSVMFISQWNVYEKFVIQLFNSGVNLESINSYVEKDTAGKVFNTIMLTGVLLMIPGYYLLKNRRGISALILAVLGVLIPASVAGIGQSLGYSLAMLYLQVVVAPLYTLMAKNKITT